MFTKETTTEDLIASIYSAENGFVKMAAFNALEIRCGRPSAVKHWKLAGNGEASMPVAPAPEQRIGDVLKKSISKYISEYASVMGFVPDTWGRIELEGGNGDYREIVVAGYSGLVRKSFVVCTYETGTEIRITGIDEIVRR